MANITVIDAVANEDIVLTRNCDILEIKRLVIPSSVILAKIEVLEIIANGMVISMLYFELIPDSSVFTSADGYLINVKSIPINLVAAMYTEIKLRLTATCEFAYKLCIMQTYLPQDKRLVMMQTTQKLAIDSYISGFRFSSITDYLIVKSRPINHIIIKNKNDMIMNEYFSYTLEYTNIKPIKQVNNLFRSSYKKLSKDLIKIINEYIGTWHFYKIPISQNICEPIININGQNVEILYTVNKNEVVVSRGSMMLRYIN